MKVRLNVFPEFHPHFRASIYANVHYANPQFLIDNHNNLYSSLSL